MPLDGMMGNYQWAYLIGLSFLIIAIIVIVAIAVAFPRKRLKETMSNETLGEAEKVEEILICPYCKTRNSPSARFCRNCGASLES